MTVQMNPVLARELKERVRGFRAFAIAAVFVAFLALTAFLVYEGNKASVSTFDLGRQTRIGRDLFDYVLFVMTLLVLFFVPGLSAGAVAGERERQTLLPLQVTLLRPRSILWGKITAAVAYLALLVLVSMPVLAVAFLLGGIEAMDIVRGVGAILLLTVLLAAMVVSMSTFVRRVQAATLLAYALTALVSITGPLLYGTAAVLDERSGNDDVAPPAFLLTANPLVLVADIAADPSSNPTSPLVGITEGVRAAKAQNDDSWFALFPDVGRNDFVVDDDKGASGVPAWLLGVASLGGLTLLMFVVAARRLRAPAETER